MSTTIACLSNMRAAALGLIQLAKDDLDRIASTPNPFASHGPYANSLRQEIAQHMNTVALLTIEIHRLQAEAAPQGTPWNDVPEPN